MLHVSVLLVAVRGDGEAVVLGYRLTAMGYRNDDV